MIKSLTSLRGIFILFIFFHHCLGIYPGGGTMAVTFFFVIGGFSMTIGYKDKVLKPDFSYRQYITRRSIKFYPLHWMCLLAILPLTLFSFNVNQIPAFFANAALLQTWIPVKSVYFSFNGVSWYLADTVFFALIFPFLFKRIFKSSTNGRILIALLMALLYICVAIVIQKDMHHAILYISPYMRLTDFVFGIYLGLLYLELKENANSIWKSGIWSYIVITVLIVLLVLESCWLSEDTTYFSPVYWPLIAILIVYSSLLSSNNGCSFLEHKYLQRLGELSFIIFMTHPIVLRYIQLMFDKILHFENNFLYVVLTLTLTIMLSVIVDKYILKPITQRITKRIEPSLTVCS